LLFRDHFKLFYAKIQNVLKLADFHRNEIAI